MTRAQANWAAKHDWCVRADVVGDEYVVETIHHERDIYTDGTAGEWRAVTSYFDSFEALSAWAGY